MKTLLTTLAFIIQGLSFVAKAQTSVTWTIAHGGLGQIALHSDGTFYSSCQPHPNYPNVICPSTSGSYQKGTGGSSAYLYFYGDDSKIVAYRMSGPTTAPDVLTQTTNARYYSGLIIKKSDTFVCTQFYDTVYNFSKGPIGVPCSGGKICARGSNQLLGSPNFTYVYVAEISPNYFVKGKCY